MAVSVTDLNTALDSQNTAKKIKAIKQVTLASTTLWYCLGGTVKPGHAKWIEVTTADNTATQASTVTSGI